MSITCLLLKGSGKTYTMGTGSNCALLDEEIGILPRAINDIFQIIEVFL